jgi:hypothetical protein
MYFGKDGPHILGYICHFKKKMLKVNIRPLGDNSPNLVTQQQMYFG